MLILTEKPSTALSFANALGCHKKQGYFENDNYCVVYAFGHLLSLAEPGSYDPSLSKWNLQSLPVIPPVMRYLPITKTKHQLEIIKRCINAHKNDTFLLATDAEREGELIGDEILRYAGFSGFLNAKRFWVSEALTREVILSGIQNAKPLSAYSSYKQEGYARQHADWLVGMNISRFLSLKCGTLLTVGRVQSAILAALYEREKLIASFSKDKYVQLVAAVKADAVFRVKLVNTENKQFPTRFPEYSPLVNQVLASCVPPLAGTVESLNYEKKTVLPPQLFNITALQKEAHKAFNYSPEQTLNIAQSLYENHKCLSYPRTPSRVMGDSNVALVKDIYGTLKKAYPKEAEGSNETAVSPDNKRLFNSKNYRITTPLSPWPLCQKIPQKRNPTFIPWSWKTSLPYSNPPVSIMPFP
jgi:DNA topoisomerase-3